VKPYYFSANAILNTYSPPIQAEELQYVNLNNWIHYKGRLIAKWKWDSWQSNLSTPGVPQSFGVVRSTLTDSGDLYLYTDTKIFRLLSTGDSFGTTAIINFANPVSQPFYSVEWGAKSYFCRDRFYLFWASRTAANLVVQSDIVGSGRYDDGSIVYFTGGRFLIEADRHLLLGHTYERVLASNQGYVNPSEVHPRRIRWSDLEDPEDWEVTSGSEAGYFDLPYSARYITGISYLNNRIFIFCPREIWEGYYIGLAAGIYQFRQSYPGVGNVYPHALITTQNNAFFIGNTNIYQIQNGGLKEIGDPIFEFFKEDFKYFNQYVEVRGYHLPTYNLVFWTYTNNSDNQVAICYNYREGKWSKADMEDLGALFAPDVKFRTFTTIDEYDTINLDQSPWTTVAIDGDWQYNVVEEVALMADTSGNIFELDATKFASKDDSAQTCTLETHDFFFGSSMDMEELDELKLVCTRVGSPDLTLSIGTRNNQDESLTWTDLDIDNIRSNDIMFGLRSVTASKYIRIKIVVNNTDTDYISELYGFEFTLVSGEENVKISQ
jgi:hypothetical protein